MTEQEITEGVWLVYCYYERNYQVVYVGYTQPESKLKGLQIWEMGESLRFNFEEHESDFKFIRKLDLKALAKEGDTNE